MTDLKPNSLYSPAERMRMLCDGVEAHVLADRRLKQFDDGIPDDQPISQETMKRLAELIDEERKANERVVALCKTMMADRTLERCAELLKAAALAA